MIGYSIKYFIADALFFRVGFVNMYAYKVTKKVTISVSFFSRQ